MFKWNINWTRSGSYVVAFACVILSLLLEDNLCAYDCYVNIMCTGRSFGAYNLRVATPRALVYAGLMTSGDARSWYMINGDANGSFEDSERSDKEYSEDGASYMEGGFETPLRMVNQSYSEALSSKESVHWKKAINEEMVSLEKNQTCSLVRLPAEKKASQRLWMFKVKEEHDGRKRYKARLVVKGFQQKRGVDYNKIFSPLMKMTTMSWAERKPIVQIEGNSIQTDSSIEAKMMDRCSEKQVLGNVFTVGVTTVEWESRLQKSITMLTIEV
ncbi:retrovirus-related pol polyprotein from transposon TNT 1-94 [Tanacetum coccineum]